MNGYSLPTRISALCLLCCLTAAPALAWNQLPVPEIKSTVTPYSQYIASGNTVTLDGGWSYDPDGWIVDYEWDVYKKNGSSYSYYATQYGSPTSRRFTTPARYRLDLYVQDNDNEWSSSWDSCYVTAVDVTITNGDEYMHYGGSDQADIYYTILPNDPDLRCSSTLLIKDSSQNTIRTISLGPNVGSQYTSWDGLKNDGSPAPWGTYTAVIQMTVAYGGPTFYSNSHSITVVRLVIYDREPFLGVPAGDFGECEDVYYQILPESIPDSYRIWLVVRDWDTQEVVWSADVGNTLGYGQASWCGGLTLGGVAPPGRYEAAIQLRIDPSGSTILSSNYADFDVVWLAAGPSPLVLPLDLGGDTPEGQVPTNLIRSIDVDLDPFVGLEVTLSQNGIVQLYDGSGPITPPKTYNTYPPLSSLGADGVSLGFVTVTFRAKTQSGQIITQRSVDIIVTEPISHCPTGTIGTIWKPGIGPDFDGTDGQTFTDMTRIQGYTITMIEDADQYGFGGCTLAAYKGLSASSLLHFMGPPDAQSWGHPAVYGTQSACIAWKGAEAMPVWQVEGDVWCVIATSSWLTTNFAPGLDATKAIVHWALGSSDAYKNYAGGRWRVGYSGSAYAGTAFQPTTEQLLRRMNGTQFGGTRRTAGEAWGAGADFPSATVMDGNPWTTLCPAPIESNATYPQVVPQRTGSYWCGIIFDTYMDTTITGGLKSVPGGNSLGNWYPYTQFGSHVLGFTYYIYSLPYQARTIRAEASGIVGGGKSMDGNRVAPNGENPADNLTWQY